MSGKEPNIRPTRRRTARFAIGFLPGARCPRKDYAGDAAEDSSNPKPSTAKYRSSTAFRKYRERAALPAAPGSVPEFAERRTSRDGGQWERQRRPMGSAE